MKNYIRTLLLTPIIAIFFAGCYTVVLMPDQDYKAPDEQSNQEDSFYRSEDFGGYDYYYNQPWWYSATTPSYFNTSADKRDSVQNTQFIRNNNGERNIGGRDIPFSIPATSTPSSTGASSSTTTTKTNSDPTTRVESTGSTNSNRSSNNSNNATRNNDGNRNTDGRKK